MAPPKIWLPPLNSYPDSSVSVVAEQPINSCYDPSILDPIFLVEVSVSVNFYSDRNDSDIMFKGLYHNQFFTIDCHELDSKESSGGTISELFRQSYIPFDLNEVYLTERQFRGEFVLPWPVKNLNSLVKKIGIFANRIRQETYNAGHNILPLKLSICKRVTVPDWDIGAWIRGFNRKCRDDPDFEEEYMKAISRPRTIEEEQYELIKYD